jgi:hypothetical protein
MTRRNQIATGLLIAILGVLAYQIYSYTRPQAAVVVAKGPGKGFVPLAVENPALRVDLLAQLKTFQYEGPRRNIFTAAPVPAEQPPSAAPVVPVVSAVPAPPPGPPPLVVPATYFGHMTDVRSGTRRAFFSQGDDVYVLGLGDLLMNRFRLVQIGENTAELEEVATGRRTTVRMEQPAS